MSAFGMRAFLRGSSSSIQLCLMAIRGSSHSPMAAVRERIVTTIDRARRPLARVDWRTTYHNAPLLGSPGWSAPSARDMDGVWIRLRSGCALLSGKSSDQADA